MRGRRLNVAPVLTDMTLSFAGSGLSSNLTVDLRTGAYRYTDAAGKMVSATTGFDSQILLQWLSGGGWKPGDPVDQQLADGMMTCIAATSPAQAAEKEPTQLPINGTSFGIKAFPTFNFDPGGSYGYPPNWPWLFVLEYLWVVLWLLGVVWLVRRQRWRFKKG